MNITFIKIYPFDTGLHQSSLRAYADVVLDDLLVIKGFKSWLQSLVVYL